MCLAALDYHGWTALPWNARTTLDCSGLHLTPWTTLACPGLHWTGSDEFVVSFHDQCLDYFEFGRILKRTCKFKGWCGTLNISAANTVVDEPINSYSPPTSRALFFTETSRKVVLRRASVCTIMWSMMTLKDDEKYFRRNDFALICHRQTKAVCIVGLTTDKCDDKEVESDPGNADPPEVVADDGNNKRKCI